MPFARTRPSLFTFDVFDTAITRLVLQPDHLHWLVARHARARGLTRMDADTWRAGRIAAERAARQSKLGDEITLDDIYLELKRRLRDSGPFVARMAALELEIERAMVCGIAPTRRRIDALGEAGERILFLSDTYFDAATVADLLRTGGYDVDERAVCVSSAHGASKARGDLYDTVVAASNLAPVAIAHEGDTPRADIVNARRAGVQARRFVASQPSRYERRLFARAVEDDLASVIAGAARGARLSFEESTPRAAALARVGAGVAGPLLTAFVLWTLEQARRDGVTRLYFLARDGQILTRLAQMAAAWTGLGIECRYLLGSRQAFYLPSLPADPLAAVDVTLGESDGRRVGEYLSELEIDEATAKTIVHAAGLDREERLTAEASARLRIALEHSPALGALTVRRRVRAEALRGYLEAEGVFDPQTSSAIVDLGWKGNLQRRLEQATGLALRGYYYDLDRIPADLRGTTATFAGGAFRNAEILESFCMATHSSVQGFSVDAHGAAVADVASWQDEEAATWGIETQQTAILRYAALLFHALPRSLTSSDEIRARLRAAGLSVFGELIEYPAPDEAAAYGSVRHARGQRHEDGAELAPRLSSPALCRAMVSRRYRLQLNTWMQGAVVRSRHSLAGVAALALLRLRQRRRRSARHGDASST
jgi:FMN phosphatase YigB (HAD superfamily)